MKKASLLLLLSCANFFAWGNDEIYYPSSITSAALTSGAICAGAADTITVNYATSRTGGTLPIGGVVDTVFEVSVPCSSCTGGTALSGITPATFVCVTASSGSVSIIIPASAITIVGTHYYYVKFHSVEATIYSGSVTLTMNQLPVVSAITGADILCAGNTTTFSDTATSGAWSSTQPSLAIVSSAGVVTGVTAGTDTIEYLSANSCGAATASQVITINTDAWTGATSTDWNTTTNWGCGTVPSASTPAVIPGGITNMPLISTGSFAADSLYIASGDTLTIDSDDMLSITGGVVNGSIVTGSGLLALAGTSAQVLYGKSTISNLLVNNSAGASINLGDTTCITGILTMNAGTFTTHNGLTLVSNAAGTASIGEITGGAISGNVSCQKYIAVPGTDTNRRAYRFWAHPFSTSIPLSQLEKDIDITGSGGAINGFTTTITNAPSCEWYNTISGNAAKSTDPGWTWLASGNGLGANAFKPKQGINLFIRGTKGQGLDGLPYTPSPVTITMTGPVNQGTIIDTMVSGIYSGYNQLGNPYPSPVDIGTIINNAKTAGNIAGSAFYVWNPYLATGGAFEAKTISATPYYLEAYCSFQVQTPASCKTITFSESNKSAIDSESLLRQEDPYVSLFIYDGSYNIWDKFYLSFNNQATDALDDYDAGKPVNPDLNFYGLSTDNDKLSIDARPYANGQIIPLGITTKYNQQYIIRAENMAAPAGGQLYLHDKYLKQYVALQEGTEYRFNITDDAASQGNNRFELGVGAIPNEALAQGNGLSLSLMPNPATSEVTCNYQSVSAQSTSIRVTDISGASVITRELGTQQSGSISLTLGNLASGVYMIELVSGDKKVVQRLVKE